MSDDEDVFGDDPGYLSPVDGHMHYAIANREGCAVCELEMERDRLIKHLNEYARACPAHVAERDRLRAAIARMEEVVEELDRKYRDAIDENATDRLAAHADLTRAEAERDRLRAVAVAAQTLIQELDTNPIGEYGDAVCEAIDQLDAKLKGVARAALDGVDFNGPAAIALDGPPPPSYDDINEGTPWDGDATT